ncbi:MAG: hypothetical protein R3F30_16570, partial [Planctomycetota bacterium]
IADQFLRHKNRRLLNSLPPWLIMGLAIHIGTHRMKGSRLEPKPDEWDMEAIREGLREDSFKPTKELISARDGDSFDRNARIQSLAMIQFLRTKGQRNKKYKNIISDYLGLLDKKMREFQKSRSDEFVEAVGEAGDDDGDSLRRWISEWEKKRNAIYDECQKAVFGSWDDDDWKRFDDDWKKIF